MAVSKAQKARVRKAMSADEKSDAKRGIKQNSVRDRKIDAAVRARAKKGK